MIIVVVSDTRRICVVLVVQVMSRLLLVMLM